MMKKNKTKKFLVKIWILGGLKNGGVFIKKN